MNSAFKVVALFAAIHLSSWVQADELPNEPDCVPEGKVLLPASNRWTTNIGLINQVKDQSIVLLGEHHDNVEHHRWQLQMITALHLLKPDLVLGFEMFPRQVQPVLDRWVAGELAEDEFLKQAKWAEYWNFDAGLYLPLFHYARMNKIPIYALNVDRTLIHKVGVNGWDNVPVSEREGVSRPAPASDDYKKMLASVFMSHGTAHSAGADSQPDSVLANPAFNRFVESQSVWDRAMAEGIIAGRQKNHGATMVAVMGSGHMMYHFGVPEQLKALGEGAAAVLIPWDTEFDCSYIDKKFADAVIGLRISRGTPPNEPQERPRLGVYLEKGEAGVLIKRVVPGSLADQNSLKEEDLIVEMASRPVTEVEQVVNSVKSMQAGTWLPMKVKRAPDQMLDIVVKFPNK